MKINTPITLLLTAGLSANCIFADDWGDWDDLPTEIFDTSSAGDYNALLLRLDELIAYSPDATSEQIDLWIEELNSRLNLSEDDISSLFTELDEDKENSDAFEDWIDSEADEFEDEDEDDDELDDEDEFEEDDEDDLDDEPVESEDD
jgi:hypothetical protein